MKSYGVNWFLVWVGFMGLFCPLYVWLDAILFFHWNSAAHYRTPAAAQAFCLACVWTFLYYLIYSGALADPAKLERLRQSLQKSQAARRRRYRWLITWAAIFAVIAVISLICKEVFHQPSWQYLVGYSLILPSTSLFSVWLLDKSAEKGQLAQMLKRDDETTS